MSFVTLLLAAPALRLPPYAPSLHPLAFRRIPAPLCSERPRGNLGGRVSRRSGDDEYTDALLDAQRATARLRDVEQQMSRRSRAPNRTPRRPPGARTAVSRTDAGTLLLAIPQAGVMSGSTLVGGAFSIAWFSAIVPATFSMASGGLGTALFMLPFWAAGGLVAKQTLLDPATSTDLSIGEFAWELRQQLAGQTLSSEGGDTGELGSASVEVAAYVNGVPNYVLRLEGGSRAGGGVASLGSGLPVAELEYLADEINAHLATLRGDGDA